MSDVIREAVHAETLLPPNATPFERALAAPTARLTAIPVPLRKLWRPRECPAPLLPWLAWGMSVDTWDPAWSESKKRDVIEASFPLHRIKGTRAALERALAVIDEGISVEEWFEYGGQPYRFRLTQNVPGFDAWSGHRLGLIYKTAVRAKNVRSWLESIRVRRVPVVGQLRVGAAVVIRARIRNLVDQATEIMLPRAQHRAGAVVITRTRIRVGV